MPQIVQNISSAAVAEPKCVDPSFTKSEYSASDKLNPNLQLSSVMSDLNRLSKSFVNSYQNLEGQVEQLNGQLQNVSEQRSEAIEEKQAITDRLQNLLAILPSGVVVLDGDGIVRDCNAVAINILGRPLLGEAWLDVINRAFLPQADDGHQISLKDGRKVHIETRALDSEPGQMIVLTDMTKTRQLQAQLSQQQKLSSMGKMIASLAHQIRTPLSAAMLYGSHLTGNKISNEKKQEFSEHLFERLKFMDRQISDMLNFVKGERKEKQKYSINELVISIQNACVSFKHPIRFDIDDKSIADHFVMLDIDGLVGAMSNLVDNAIDATDDQKEVVVRLKATANNRLVIQVIDQGHGIDAAKKKQLFEPFYSTKNHGNGLGLAIVYGVVIDHQGMINVDSALGTGSVFNIILPTNNDQERSIKKDEYAESSVEKLEGAVYDY